MRQTCISTEERLVDKVWQVEMVKETMQTKSQGLMQGTVWGR